MTSIPAQVIKRARVFASLSDEEAARLGSAMEEIRTRPGEVLFLEGEVGDRFFAVWEGHVEIVKALGTEEERVLSIRGPGDYFGEMSLLDPAGGRTATARTPVSTRLLSLSRQDFLQLLQTQPEPGIRNGARPDAAAPRQ